MSASAEPESLLRMEAVMARTGMSRSLAYREVQAGRFPQPVKLTPRLSVWPASEVDAWIERQKAKRDFEEGHDYVD